MKLLGLEVRVAPRAGLSPVVDNRGGWWPIVREPSAGAWQRNQEWTLDSVLSHPAVYACITQIAADFGKLRPKLMKYDGSDIGEEITRGNTAHLPLLRRPNRFQDHIQFKSWWVTSKLTNGNTYVLLERDNRGVVSSMYILDPTRVQVLVAEDGAVFYKLKRDNLAGWQDDDVSVPATEIVHDRMNCLFHPLVGTSPIFACGTAAGMGISIEQNSAAFFANGSNPSGILSATVSITAQKAEELSALWNGRFGKDKSGGVAVLGDGMKFEPMRMSSSDSQMFEQLGWTSEAICSAFHVPAWKVGVGQQPAYTKPEIANQAYYSDCLQAHIEPWEACMNAALGFESTTDGKSYGVELDLDGLLRMDLESQITTLAAAVGGSLLTVNDARKRLSLKPVDGGDEIWMQQQNYSLPALAERDRSSDPFGTKAPALPAPDPQKQLPAGDTSEEDDTRAWADLFTRDIAALETESLAFTGT